MPATYGGLAIFGVGVSLKVQDTEPRAQEAAYPGGYGVERIDMGGQGSFAVAKGMLYANTPALVEALEAAFRSLKDGTPRPLVSAFGTVFSVYAVLVKFDPDDVPIKGPDNRWGYSRRYTAVFRLPVD